MNTLEFFSNPIFDSAELVAASQPFAQILHPSSRTPKETDDFGLAVKVEQANAAGWNEQAALAAGWKLVEWTHSDRTVCEYWLCKNPRITTIGKSPLQIKVVVQKKTKDQDEVANYVLFDQNLLKSIKQAKIEKTIDEYDIFSRNAFAILGQNNELITTANPVLLVTKNSVGTFWGKGMTGYYQSCASLFHIRVNIKNMVALVVPIQFQLKTVGTDSTSDIAAPTFGVPTPNELINDMGLIQQFLSWQKQYEDALKPLASREEQQQTADLEGGEANDYPSRHRTLPPVTPPSFSDYGSEEEAVF